MDMTINLTIQLTTPLHIAAPGDWRFDPNSQKFFLGGSKGPGVPVVRVQKMAILSESDSEHSRVDTPVITANSLRGRLRRFAANRILETLASKGQQVSLETYHTLKCGAPHGHPDSAAPSLDEVNRSSQHYYLGLFGGSPKMIRSKLIVDTGWPINPATVNAGIVPELTGAMTDNWNTQVMFFRKVDDALMGQDPLLGRVVNDAVDQVTAYRAAVGGDDETEGVVRGVRTWSSYEFVIPGTTFHLTFGGERLTPAQAGLLLASLEDLVATQKLGGKVSLGYGQFRVLGSQATIDGEVYPDLFVAGRPSKLAQGNDVVAECLLALGEELAEEDAGALESLLAPEKTVAEIVKEKRKGKKAKGASA